TKAFWLVDKQANGADSIIKILTCCYSETAALSLPKIVTDEIYSAFGILSFRVINRRYDCVLFLASQRYSRVLLFAQLSSIERLAFQTACDDSRSRRIYERFYNEAITTIPF